MEITKNEGGLFEVQIDDATYEFEKWGAEEALSTLLKIAKIAGKPIGLAVGAIMGGEEEKGTKGLLEKKISPDLLGLVFDSLTDKLDEGVVVSLIKKIGSEKVLCNGAKINFNKHYEDRLDHLLKVVAAGLEVQYGNFFGALLGLVGKKPAAGVKLANRSAM